MPNIVFFDLETQKSRDEVGGWANARLMKVSLGVTYSTTRGTYEIYGYWRVNELAEELRRADLVVGYNIAGFDYEVLAGHHPFFDPAQVRTLDLLWDVQKVVPHRLSLDAIATATLGIEKTSDGLQALRWFREGKLMEIAEYCCYDVKITRLVYEYGREHHQVHYTDRYGKRLTVPVKW